MRRDLPRTRLPRTAVAWTKDVAVRTTRYELNRIPSALYNLRADGFDALYGLVFCLLPRDPGVNSEVEHLADAERAELLNSALGDTMRELAKRKRTSGLTWAVSSGMGCPAPKSRTLKFEYTVDLNERRGGEHGLHKGKI